jgi:hypothetical protein
LTRSSAGAFGHIFSGIEQFACGCKNWATVGRIAYTYNKLYFYPLVIARPVL